MKKERSKGVTFWGWVFMASGIFGLLGALNPKEQIQLYGLGIFIVGLFLSAATFGCGLYILKLNEGARRLAIFTCFCSILMVPIYLRPVSKDLQSDEFWQKQKQVVMQKVKPQDQDKALAEFVKIEEAGKKGKLDFVFFILAMPFVLIELVPVYFFTRPKVRNQFLS